MPSKDPRRRLLQSRTAAAVRHRLPEADDLQRELAVARVQDYVRSVLLTAPPLRHRQLQGIATTLGLPVLTCPTCVPTTADVISP